MLTPFVPIRADLAPAAQQTIFMARLGAEIMQALTKVRYAQRGRRGGNQSGFENDCGKVMRILTQPSTYYSVVAKRKPGMAGLYEKYFDADPVNFSKNYCDADPVSLR